MPAYTINLDPAVSKLPYSANIDVRDTVNYKEVMKQYLFFILFRQVGSRIKFEGETILFYHQIQFRTLFSTRFD